MDFSLTYVSQQDRAVRSQPSDYTLHKLHEVLFSVLKNMFDAHLHFRLVTSTSRWRHIKSFKLKFEIDSKTNYDTLKPYLKKPSRISQIRSS